jgi:endonuclease YncB( thermonuclease family)
MSSTLANAGTQRCTAPPGSPAAPAGWSPLPPSRTRTRWTCAARGVVMLLLLVAAVGCRGDDGGDDSPGVREAPAASAELPGEPSVGEAPPPEQPPAEPPAEPPAADPALLRAADGGDGDSWRDTGGREYRLGLVNTPEQGECYAGEATAERRRLVADGFRAEVYATDRYGRSVAVVTSAGGENVNVHLARNGFADDRYLQRHRHENPTLAAELDEAFRAAKAEGAGLWGQCRTGAAAAGAPVPAPAPPPDTAVGPGGCHPAYVPCVAVQGDGSGRGSANDLDCSAIGKRVQLKTIGVDPYRLDSEGNGFGCESYS